MFNNKCTFKNCKEKAIHKWGTSLTPKLCDRHYKICDELYTEEMLKLGEIPK